MLYDNHTDIKQNIDLSKMKSSAKIVEKYKEKLRIKRAEVNKDPFQK